MNGTFILFLPVIFNLGGEELPPIMTATANSEPDSYALMCDPEYEINIMDEEIHF